MMDAGLSAADVLALARETGGDRDNGFLEGNGIIILILFFLIMLGGGNMFGNNRGYGNELSGVATRMDITNGFNFNQLDNGIRGVERGLCDLGYASLNQTNQLGMAIANLGFQQKDCCCEINRNIDAVRAENYKNTCDITTAIHNEAEQTRGLITANVIQELRDQNTAYQLQLSNQAQTANLVEQLKPQAVPAYITCSPYQSQILPYAFGAAFGSGYGNCNRCNTCNTCNSVG